MYKHPDRADMSPEESITYSLAAIKRRCTQCYAYGKCEYETDIYTLSEVLMRTAVENNVHDSPLELTFGCMGYHPLAKGED